VKTRRADLEAALGDNVWLDGNEFITGNLMMIPVLSGLRGTAELADLAADSDNCCRLLADIQPHDSQANACGCAGRWTTRKAGFVPRCRCGAVRVRMGETMYVGRLLRSCGRRRY